MNTNSPTNRVKTIFVPPPVIATLKEVYDINHEINTSSLKEGLYIFLIKNRNNQIIKKLYKSK